MKKTVLVLLLAICVFVANAQKKPQKKVITHTVKTKTSGIELIKFFYTAYMEAMASNNDPRLTDSRLRLLRRTYFTKRCLDRYDELSEKTDADAIVKAQDSNEEALKSLQVIKSKDPKKPNDYTVSYSVGDIKVEIKLTLVNEAGKLKIDYLE